MAGTWTVDIDVVHIPEKCIRVTGTRTNDADPENPFVHSEEISVDTSNQTLAEIRDDLVARMKLKFQAQRMKQEQVDTIIETWQSALADALNDEEPI
jgi:predicted XRE-type DNA-binding protein